MVETKMPQKGSEFEAGGPSTSVCRSSQRGLLIGRLASRAIVPHSFDQSQLGSFLASEEDSSSWYGRKR